MIGRKANTSGHANAKEVKIHPSFPPSQTEELRQWQAARSKPKARAKVQTRVKSEEPSLPAKRIKRETDETPRNAGSWADAGDVSAAAASPTTFPVPAAPSRSLPFYAMPPPSVSDGDGGLHF